VGVCSTALGLFFRSLEEGIAAAAMAAVATFPTMTKGGDVIAREKDHASYRTLFRDLEGCGSYARDLGYRTPDGGWLVVSILNSLPCGVGDLPTTTTTTTSMSSGRGRCSSTTPTANGEDCKYDDECGNGNNNYHGTPSLLSVCKCDLM
jgi:hypothetical protein